MKRLAVLGLLLATVACAQQQPPPPVAAPPPPPVAAAPPPPAPAPPPPLASYNGRYAGMMTVGVSGAETEGTTYPICSDRRVNMTIRNGYATISYRDWKQHLLHYRGPVDPSGTINMSHLNGDGSRSEVTLRISDNGISGQLQRGDCWYNVQMNRA
jgi:hypothetical protein